MQRYLIPVAIIIDMRLESDPFATTCSIPTRHTGYNQPSVDDKHPIRGSGRHNTPR